MSDQVNHPLHYLTVSELGRPFLLALGVREQQLSGECINAIESLEADGASFARLTAIKYLWRCGLKGGESKIVEDLSKAVWYLRRINNVRYESVIDSIKELIDYLRETQCDK